MVDGAARRLAALITVAAGFLTTFATLSLAQTGQPQPWQRGLQDAVTPVAESINSFYDFTNIIIVAVALFVMVLLIIVMWKFRESANPTPSRTTHNTTLEVAWTVVPVIILVVIAIPSFNLLFLQYSFPKPDLTIKAVGNAWFWEHQYPDHGNFTVTSNMIRDEDLLKAEVGPQEFAKRYASLDGIELATRLQADAGPLWKKAQMPRLLAVNNEIAVPLNKTVHVLVTANDVIHNWTVPAFGSKTDAVPGRITATWFKATQPGIYYGQCSELCGKDHAFMPIAVRVVSETAFASWVEAAKAGDWKKAAEILKQATPRPGGGQNVAAVAPADTAR